MSGLTLASAAIALVPVDSFVQQAWVFGLIGAATLSASVAYAVSMPAFLTFALSCLLPSIAFLFVHGDDQQRGWGWLGLILLMALSRGGVAGQSADPAWLDATLSESGADRAFAAGAKPQGEQLNQQLAREIEQRR